MDKLKEELAQVQVMTPEQRQQTRKSLLDKLSENFLRTHFDGSTETERVKRSTLTRITRYLESEDEIPLAVLLDVFRLLDASVAQDLKALSDTSRPNTSILIGNPPPAAPTSDLTALGRLQEALDIVRNTPRIIDGQVVKDD